MNFFLIIYMNVYYKRNKYFRILNETDIFCSILILYDVVHTGTLVTTLRKEYVSIFKMQQYSLYSGISIYFLRKEMEESALFCLL
jgi:hypothetical protein